MYTNKGHGASEHADASRGAAARLLAVVVAEEPLVVGVREKPVLFLLVFVMTRPRVPRMTETLRMTPPSHIIRLVDIDIVSPLPTLAARLIGTKWSEWRGKRKSG